MGWNKYDDDMMMRRMYWFDEYRSASHVDGHGLQIVSEKVMHPVAMLKRTQHTIELSFGAYGETSYTDVLPFGTSLANAKKLAIKAAQLCNSEHGSNFILPTTS